jgi:hypothetical protein
MLYPLMSSLAQWFLGVCVCVDYVHDSLIGREFQPELGYRRAPCDHLGLKGEGKDKLILYKGGYRSPAVAASFRIEFEMEQTRFLGISLPMNIERLNGRPAATVVLPFCSAL